MTFTVNNSTEIAVAYSSPYYDFTPPVTTNYTNSMTIMVVPSGQTPSIWQQQAWQSLMINGIVTGNVINRNQQITTAYANIYNTNTQAFGWAAMAAFGSYAAGQGMAKAVDAAWYEKVGGVLAQVDRFEVLDYLGQGNIAIFMDMYPQLLAYSAGGLANINTMAQQNQITPTQLYAWQQIQQGINTGNADTIWGGNAAIVWVEQAVTAQPMFNKNLGLWKTATAWGPKIVSPMPGDGTVFQTLWPGQSFSNPTLRYGWAVFTMIPAIRKWQLTNPNIILSKLLSGGYTN
jgi:hypothetical protein